MTDVHSKEAQRHAIFTFWKMNKKVRDIHQNLQKIHGNKTVSLASVYRWVDEFKLGRTDVADLPRSGRPTNSTSEMLPRRIQDLLNEDARVSVREISDRLDAPKSTIHDCMIKEMGLVKLTARWVPRLLTPEMQENRRQICESNLHLIDEHGGWDAFHPLVVTGDETWIPYFDPPTKEESKIWVT